MESKVWLPKEVKIEQVQEFWKHNIHPITGQKITKLSFLTASERKQQEFNREQREKFNKE